MFEFRLAKFKQSFIWQFRYFFKTHYAIIACCTLILHVAALMLSLLRRPLLILHVYSVQCYALHWTDNKTMTTTETLRANKGLIIVLCLCIYW